MSESANKTGEELDVSPDFMLVDDDAATTTIKSGPTATEQGWQIARELMETVVLSLIIFFVIRMGVQNFRRESICAGEQAGL
jgi:hypothetical protein